MMPLTGFQKTLEGLLAANSALKITKTNVTIAPQHVHTVSAYR